jgi:hypothetical protein
MDGAPAPPSTVDGRPSSVDDSPPPPSTGNPAPRKRLDGVDDMDDVAAPLSNGELDL